MRTNPRDPGPHSPFCNARKHAHGSECSPSCPTCGGSVFVDDETEGETEDQPESPVRVSFTVVTTRHTYESEAMDISAEDLATMQRILKDLKDLDNLVLAESDGTEVSFNPQYVVSVTMHKEAR